LAPIDRGPIFDNQQTPAGRVQYSERPSDAIQVSALPPDWRNPTAAILAPVASEVGDEWAGAFHATTTVAVAVQGLVRELGVGEPVRPLPLRRSALVERAQMLLISAEDVAAGSVSLTDLLVPDQELAVTHGAAGALWLSGGAARYLPPAPKRDPVDTTGAGDVFLGAWVAARLLLGDAEPWRALVVASAMASLSTQARMLSEFPAVSDLCEVLVRLRDRQLG